LKTANQNRYKNNKKFAHIDTYCKSNVSICFCKPILKYPNRFRIKNFITSRQAQKMPETCPVVYKLYDSLFFICRYVNLLQLVKIMINQKKKILFL